MIDVLLLALLPAAGNITGGLVAEVTPPSDRWRNRALHAAAGSTVRSGSFHGPAVRK